MAREVPPELREFRDKVEGSLDSMSSTATDICNKINDINTIISSTKPQIESNYESSTEVNQAVTKLSNTTTIINGMKSNIEGTINGAIGKARNVCDQTNTLDKLVAAITESEKTISTENAKEEPNQFNLINAKNTLKKSEEEFDKIKPEAEAELNALKAMDGELSSKSDNSSAADTKDDTEQTASESLQAATLNLQNLKYGSFIEDKFTSSTGKTIEYSIYIPDYGTGSVPEGLPVFTFIHGGDKNGTSKVAWDNGITRMIRKKEVTPSGIVISPYCVKFEDPETRQAIKELNDEVIKKYKCDTDRISIGGASFGSITAYQMINENPGYYSACVAISGYDEVTNAFNDVAVWALHGTKDQGRGRTKYNVALQKMEEIKNVGGSAYMSPMPIDHSNTSNRAFKDGYTSPDGEVISPMEWAFKQSKKANKERREKLGGTKA